MARLKKGLLNGFTGIIGNIVGYEMNGQYIIRSRRPKANKPPTLKQLACRERMRLVNNMLKCFPDFVKLGFAAVAEGQTFLAYNAAVAYQLSYAITGSYPDFRIDYSKVRVSQAVTPGAPIAASVSLQGRNLVFSWPPVTTYPHSTDHVMLLAYSPALGQAVYNLCGAKRRTVTDLLALPDGWSPEHPVHLYLAFRSEHTGQCTDSVYLGNMDIPEAEV